MSISSRRAALPAGRRTSDHPEAPVCLDIYAGGRLIGQTLANRYREDLMRAGLGSGRHSFEFTPPAGLASPPTRSKCAARSTVPRCHAENGSARPSLRRAVHERRGNPGYAAKTSRRFPPGRSTVFKMADCVYRDADAIIDSFADRETGTADSAETILHAEG